MSARDRILAATRSLALTRPKAEITLAEVARAAGVTWPTARRHIGSSEKLMELLGVASDQRETPSDVRARILASAREVVAEHGIDGASLDAVGAAAGLTKGAIYWHFTSKKDLILTLLEQRCAELRMAAPPADEMFPEAVPLYISVAQRIAIEVRTIVDDPSLAPLMTEFIAHAREPEVLERMRMLYGLTHAAILERLHDLKNKGRLDPEVDLDAFAVLYTSIYDGLMMRYRVSPEALCNPRLAETIGRVLALGLVPRR